MAQAQPPITYPEPQTFCINHPQTPTSLRCNRCGNPICTKCAVRTPVGYRCKTCVRNQQAVFYTATPRDYVVAAVITFPLALVGQLIGPMLGFFALFAGPIVGGLIAELVWRATGKRRGKYTWLIVAGCMIIVALPVVVWPLLVSAVSIGSGSGLGRAGLYGVLSLLWPVIYLILAVGSAIARLRYGK
jgi:hypothetical protein